MVKLLRIVFVVIALASLTGRALAATQTILGKSFLVKDAQPNVDPAQRKLVAVGKELASPDSLVGNPIANGATIQIIANGGASTSQTFTLPAGAAPQGGTGWKALGSPPLGYLYKDSPGTNGPVKVASIKRAANGNFVVKAVILGALGPGPQPHVVVLPPDPGTDGGMIFTLGGGDSYCIAFGGAAGGKVVNNANKVFKINANADFPTSEAGCPVAAGPTTTTSSSTTTSTFPVSSTTVSFAIHVQPIFNARCALPGCHTGAFPAQGLNLSMGNAYAALNPGVNHSTECPTKLLVVPAGASTSYIIQKLQGAGPGCFVGSQMPLIGGPLTPGELSLITNWIAQGAQNN